MLQFPDVSHYQSGLSLKGAPACIAKATQGSTYRDPGYPGFKAQAAAFGVPFAAYHWVDTSDLAAQAANAHAVIGSTPTMWDAEAAGATVPRLVELTARYRALGGNPRLVYLPHWWWQDHLGSPDLRPLTAAGLGLVSSSYPAAGYTDAGPGWAAYGGVTPVIWQYTDKQPFGGQRVDFNAYRGTATQLATLLGAGAPTKQQEDDMELGAEWDGSYLIKRIESLVRMNPTYTVTLPDKSTRTETNALVQAVQALQAPAPVQVDATAVADALAGNTAFLAALAKAVNDDLHARTAE